MGLAGQLDDLERVVDGLVEPGVAGDDADADDVDVGRLSSRAIETESVPAGPEVS